MSDGFVGGTWALDGTTLHVRHVGLGAGATKEVEAEGLELLRFLGVAAGDIRLTALS